MLIQADICDRAALDAIFVAHRPSSVMHLAAETHVDRSIDDPAIFVHTNIVGTMQLLEAARKYWSTLHDEAKSAFRLLHVSTDEVYGDLANAATPANEQTPYNPGSPYSASKAAADHLLRAWNRTYGLPVVISNCSNNYGPFQFPEKLIPHMILNALAGRPLPVYGDGGQSRDWIYVEDHARMLHGVLTRGLAGETYNISGCNEQRNLDVVESICALLDELAPAASSAIKHYRELIAFVDDRPGHDRRYAVDSGKLATELGLAPQESFAGGLRKTVQWYLANDWWWKPLLEKGYKLARIGQGLQKP